MNTDWTNLGIAFGLMLALTVLHGALVACEFSLVKLRYTLVDAAALAAARRRRMVAYMMDRADETARGIRFGLRFSAAGVGAGTAYVVLAALGHWPGATGNTNEMWAAAGAFIGAVILLYLLGDLIPRGIALAYPLPTLVATLWFALLLTLVSMPLRRVLRGISRALFRRFGLAGRQDFNLLDVEVQMRAMGEEDMALPPLLRAILTNTLRLRDLKLSDVILPRNQVVFINLQGNLGPQLELARRSGHTRFPLCDGDLDHCIGLIFIKDLYRQPGDAARLDLRQLKREILRLPETEPLPSCLEKLLRHKMHMAVAVDEFGGVAGIVTLEHIIEELVGEIHDEHETAPEQLIKPLPDGRGFRILGLAPVRDVEQAFGLVLATEEVSTFGGLVTAELGRIPAAGERVVLAQSGLEVQIEEADTRRVIAANVRLRPRDLQS